MHKVPSYQHYFDNRISIKVEPNTHTPKHNRYTDKKSQEEPLSYLQKA
jgi:hypothetical protein